MLVSNGICHEHYQVTSGSAFCQLFASRAAQKGPKYSLHIVHWTALCTVVVVVVLYLVVVGGGGVFVSITII